MPRPAGSKLRGLATMAGMLGFIGAVVGQIHTLKDAYALLYEVGSHPSIHGCPITIGKH